MLKPEEAVSPREKLLAATQRCWELFCPIEYDLLLRGAGLAAKAKSGQGQKVRRKAGSQRIDNRVEAYRNPLRRKILSYLTHSGPASPSHLARVLGEELVDVNYHVKRLKDLGCAEVVKVKRSRGKPPEKIYRATERILVELADWDNLDPATKEGTTGEAAQLHIDDLVSAFKGETLGIHEDFAMIQQRLAVDKQGLREAIKIQEETMRKIIDLQTRVLGRCAGKQPEINMSVLTSCFELPLDHR